MRLLFWLWDAVAAWLDEHPRLSGVAAALPAAAVVFVASVLPLGWMAWAILANPSVRREFALDPFRTALLARTLGYNAGAAVIATVMGLPAAFVLGRGRGLFARVLWVVMPAALILPSLSYAYGWKQCQRIIQPQLRWLGETEFHTPAVSLDLPHLRLRSVAFHLPIHVTFRPNGPADVFRCIWSLGTWLWAVPATLIGLALRRMDTSVQQQAVLDGALLRVTFRQLLGPIVASLAIVTVLATQEFAVYEPTGISVVATEVRMVFDTGSMSSADNSIAAPMDSGAGKKAPDQAARAAAAVATATPLLIVTVLLAAAAAWGVGRGSAADALSAGDWPPILDASQWAVGTTLLLLWLNIGIPVWALVDSLKTRVSVFGMFNEFGPQVAGAFIVAAAAAVLAGVASMSSAARWVPGSLAVAGASFLVGGQLLAVAEIRIYNRPALFWAYNSWVTPVITYVGRFGWLAVAAGGGTWSRPWRELRDMAAVDGAGRLRAASGVVWPLAWPTLLAGGLIVGALSMTEVPATVLLMPQNPQVLTPTLMTWVHMVRYDAMIQASLLMMASVLLPAVAAVLLASAGLRVLRTAGARR